MPTVSVDFKRIFLADESHSSPQGSASASVVESKTFTRPSGAAPKGKTWCKFTGVWIDKSSIDGEHAGSLKSPGQHNGATQPAIIVSEDVSYVRPKGRAPKGKAWCKVTGQWIDEIERECIV